MAGHCRFLQLVQLAIGQAMDLAAKGGLRLKPGVENPSSGPCSSCLQPFEPGDPRKDRLKSL
eukprot:13219547-Heterocapsa_arctica.AAC.2